MTPMSLTLKMTATILKERMTTDDSVGIKALVI